MPQGRTLWKNKSGYRGKHLFDGQHVLSLGLLFGFGTGSQIIKLNGKEVWILYMVRIFLWESVFLENIIFFVQGIRSVPFQQHVRMPVVG